MTSFLLLLALAGVAPSPYGKGPSVFTPELVCGIQHAIRFQEKAWEPWMCLRVHTAFTKAAAATKQDVRTLFAIAINESDLQPHVERYTRNEKVIKFLPGGKMLTQTQETWEGSTIDGGLMGIRCKVGTNGLCSNGTLKGWKWPQALAIENNVLLGAKILATKKSLQHYNGGTRDHGYQARIDAILLAMAGTEPKVSGKRMKKLVSQILNGVFGLVSSHREDAENAVAGS